MTTPLFAVDTEHMGRSVKPGETSVAFQGEGSWSLVTNFFVILSPKGSSYQ